MADPKIPFSAAGVRDINDRALAAGAASLTKTDGAFNIFRYPSDLGTDEHPHYLMFFITVRESDIRAAQGEQASDVQFDFSQNNTGVDKSAATAQAATKLAGAAAGGVLGGMAGAAAGDRISNATSKMADPRAQLAGELVSSVTTPIGIAAGALAGAKLAENAFDSSQKDQITLKTAIALYMTGKPSVQYQANWADQDIGIIGGLSTQLKNIDPSSLTSFEGIQASLGPAASGGLSSFILSKAQGAGGPLGDVGAGFSAAAGITANPFKAQLFKSMGFRKFSYDYAFLPKNITEYEETQKIILAFKRYMHPKFGGSKFILSYPAEFTIAYFHKANRNTALYKISNCALTNLSIEYGGTDFITFKGTAGFPTEIGMKLEFTELEVLSRERIEVGY
jgi:hypothetical protein